MAKRKLTLSIEADLIKRIRIYAVTHDTDVNTIVEKLFRSHLERFEKQVEKAKRNKT